MLEKRQLIKLITDCVSEYKATDEFLRRRALDVMGIDCVIDLQGTNWDYAYHVKELEISINSNHRKIVLYVDIDYFLDSSYIKNNENVLCFDKTDLWNTGLDLSDFGKLLKVFVKYIVVYAEHGCENVYHYIAVHSNGELNDLAVDFRTKVIGGIHNFRLKSYYLDYNVDISILRWFSNCMVSADSVFMSYEDYLSAENSGIKLNTDRCRYLFTEYTDKTKEQIISLVKYKNSKNIILQFVILDMDCMTQFYKWLQDCVDSILELGIQCKLSVESTALVPKGVGSGCFVYFINNQYRDLSLKELDIPNRINNLCFRMRG